MDITLPQTVEEFNSKLRVHACSKDSSEAKTAGQRPVHVGTAL